MHVLKNCSLVHCDKRNPVFWVIYKAKQIDQFTTDSNAFNFFLKLKSSSSLSIQDLWYFFEKTLTIRKYEFSFFVNKYVILHCLE